MISLPAAAIIALLTALVTWAFTWGRASRDLEAQGKKIDGLVNTVNEMAKTMAHMNLEIERLKWHTGPHSAFRSPTHPRTPNEE